MVHVVLDPPALRPFKKTRPYNDEVDIYYMTEKQIQYPGWLLGIRNSRESRAKGGIPRDTGSILCGSPVPSGTCSSVFP